MEEIVVNDTNVLVDLYTAGLLEYISRSRVRFHTVDFVMKELRRSPYQRPLIEDLVRDGTLIVVETSREEMPELLSLYSAYSVRTNLSIEDCSVLLYAKKNHFRLLTGDKKLRNHAIDEGVIVSGVLWVVDLFIDEELVSVEEMIQKLECLLEKNPRLPKKLFEEKINDLKSRLSL